MRRLVWACAASAIRKRNRPWVIPPESIFHSQSLQIFHTYSQVIQIKDRKLSFRRWPGLERGRKMAPPVVHAGCVVDTKRESGGKQAGAEGRSARRGELRRIRKKAARVRSG